MKSLFTVPALCLLFVGTFLLLTPWFTAFAENILFPLDGGTGTSTAPTYGQMLVGNANGTYDVVSTSTLGFASSALVGSGQWTRFNTSGLRPATSTDTVLVGGTATTTTGLFEVIGRGTIQYASSTADSSSIYMAGDGSAALPSYTFGSDLDTGTWFPGSNVLAWSTAGVERMRQSGATLLVNKTASSDFGTPPLVQVFSTGAAGAVSVTRGSADASGPLFIISKSRSTTPGSFSAVVDEDTIGVLRGYADDGTDFDNNAGQVAIVVDETPSTGIVPGRIVFQTTNTSGILTEAARITAAQRLGLGTTVPGPRLDISGSISGTPSLTIGSYFGITGSNSGIFTDNATADAGTATGWSAATFQGLLAANCGSTCGTGITTTDATVVAINQAAIARASQTITRSYGLYVNSSNSTLGSGGVAVTASYPARFNTQTGATTNYGIVTSGAGFSGFGTITPTSFVQIAPAATINALPTAVGTFFSVGTTNRSLNDNTTAAGAVLANATFSSFEQGIYSATNAVASTTNAISVNVAGPPRGGANAAIINAIGLSVVSTNSLTNATTPRNGIGIVSNQPTGASYNYAARFDLSSLTSPTDTVILKSIRGAVVNGTPIGGIGFQTDDTNLPVGEATTTAAIRAIATETHTAATQSTRLGFFTTATGGTATNTEKMTIRGTGMVGIGTTTPYAKLSIHANDGETNQYLFAVASSTPVATTTHFLIDRNGRTGIGTSSLTFAPLTIDTNGSTEGLLVSGTVDNFMEVLVANKSNGTTASSDFVAQSDKSQGFGAQTYYIDMGINGSNYSNPTYNLNGANDGYLYTSDSSLGIGTASTTGNFAIMFATGGFTSANERMRITGTGLLGIGSTTPNCLISVASSGCGPAVKLGGSFSATSTRMTKTPIMLVATSTVNGSATINYASADTSTTFTQIPSINITVEYNNDATTLLQCNPHTITTTAFTVECVSIATGVTAVVAADATNRTIHWRATGY